MFWIILKYLDVAANMYVCVLYVTKIVMYL